MYAEVPNDTISLEYFFNMMSPHAEMFSKEYDDAEASILKETISGIDTSEYNMVVIAGGRQRYLGLALDNFKSYTNVEPLAETYIGSELMNVCRLSTFSINTVCKKFGQITPHDIPAGHNIYVFIFNIASYIEEPFNKLSTLLKPGDIVIFSTWSNSEHAKAVRTKYFNFLNQQSQSEEVDPQTDEMILSPAMLNEDKIPMSFTKQTVHKGVVGAYIYFC